jgi:hypothetical protein
MEPITKEQKANVQKTPLINRAAVKKLALEIARNRAHKYTRVSAEFLCDMDARLRGMIVSHIHGMPSKGMTIR